MMAKGIYSLCHTKSKEYQCLSDGFPIARIGHGNF